MLPGTRMPDFFPSTAAGTLQSPFAGQLEKPWFAPVEERLLAHFESEEELEAFLLDAHRVIGALRSFVWSLPE